jgi:prevent-host-death family protein
MMSTTIPQRELRNNNADIITRVEAGESFTVTRNGIPVADVVPHVRHAGPPRVVDTETLVMARHAVADKGPDLEAWIADIRAGDEYLDDDPLNSRA